MISSNNDNDNDDNHYSDNDNDNNRMMKKTQIYTTMNECLSSVTNVNEVVKSFVIIESSRK